MCPREALQAQIISSQLIGSYIDYLVRKTPNRIVLTVDGAADGLGGAEDLLHDAREVARVGAGPHDARRVDDVVHRDVAVVTDVLHLLAVARRLLQRLQTKGG